ncbi:MAG: hypothetical protein NXI04_17355 [Planctomycetaceae bacterium]|nr:hypothetical protein [Planctomycetaceae bacterium]
MVDHAWVWVGVAAPGFEMWETTVEFWQGTHNVEVNLQAGQVVSGRVDVARELRNGLTATLLPVRRVSNELFGDKVSTRQSMMRQNVTLDQGQRFEFSHVRPGDYVLAVHGPEVSPVSQNVTVGSEPCIVKPMRLGPRGIVMGVIKDSREDDGVWAFADGSIRFSDSAERHDENDFPHLRSLSFRTDEQGRFRVPRVPVGRVTVELRYHMTADIIGRHQKEAVVRGREISEVIFEDVSPPNKPAPQGGVILR